MAQVIFQDFARQFWPLCGGVVEAERSFINERASLGWRRKEDETLYFWR